MTDALLDHLQEPGQGCFEMKTKFVLLLFFVSGACSIGQSFYESLAANRYHAESWRTTPKIAGTTSSWTPILPEDFLSSGVVVTNNYAEADFQLIRFEKTSDNGKLDLRCILFHDFPMAKRELLQTLGSMQSTNLLSAGTNGLEVVGDIFYSDEAGYPFSCFVRNNVFIWCKSTFGNPMTTNLLFTLDSQIVNSVTNDVISPPP